MDSKAQATPAVLSAVAMVLALGSSPLYADITFTDIGKNVEYHQTGPTTVGPYGTFFNAFAYMPVAGDFDTGTLTYPGPASPQTLSPGTFAGPNVFFQGSFLSDKAALDTAYPFGVYTIQAFNTSTSASSSAVGTSYTTDAYTSDIPALTLGSYNALQGLDPSQALTVHFNSFTPDATANLFFTFFHITDLITGNDVFTQSFLDPSTTSVNLSAGTLAFATPYDFEVIFSDRIRSTDVNGSGIPNELESDVRTFGNFTTAEAAATIPEPSTWLLLATGLVGVLGYGWRQRKKVA